MPPAASLPEFRRSADGIRFNPDFEPRLRALGLLASPGPAGFDAGRLVALSTEREVWRIGDADPPLYLKRFRNVAGGEGRKSGASWLRRWLNPGRRQTPAAIAWDHLCELKRRGFEVPLPVAEGGESATWFLVTAGLPGPDLASWLQDAPEDERPAVFLEAGTLLTRLAEAGWWFPDFVGKHVHVLPDGGLGLIDVDRMERRTIRPTDRLAMAADLLTTIPDPALGDSEVAAFLDGAFSVPATVRDLGAAVRERRTRRRVRRFLAPRPNRWLADRHLDRRGSIWNGTPPGPAEVESIRAGASAIDISGRRFTVIHDEASHLLRAFEAAEQLWRFGVAANVPIGLLVFGTRAALVVEPATIGPVPLSDFAAGAPEAAGVIVANLHRAGILARNLSLSPDGRVSSDGRMIMRPDPVRDAMLRRDLRSVLDQLSPETRALLQRTYDSAIPSRLDVSLSRLSASRAWPGPFMIPGGRRVPKDQAGIPRRLR